jgi:formamidopyrimidine-DNA glycosylase
MVVSALERQGKYLLMHLVEGHRLLLHLGMTGQLFVEGTVSPRLLTLAGAQHQSQSTNDPHTHLTLHFEDGAPGLCFRDVRKFGKVRLLAPGQGDPRLDKLGPDALVASAEHLFERSRKRGVPVKTFLLDQGVMAGCGNIYADEALFASGVRPTRSAARLTRSELVRISSSLHRVLLRSIETGGSSISDFIAPDGSDGQFQHERRVYARQGEPCSVCGTAIKRIVVGQRGTHYCSTCQR